MKKHRTRRKATAYGTMTIVESKGNKYGAKNTFVDGIRFDSLAEANRYCELRILERAGAISGLERQAKFVLVDKTDKFAKVEYKADFVYTDNVTGNKVVEDVKSKATAKDKVYVLKKKLLYARYGIEIKEVY